MSTLFDQVLSWMRAERPDIRMRLLHDNGWLAEHAPEIDRLYGIPQRPEHHPEVDVGRHVELALELAASWTTDPRVRYAVLVHDLGKALTPKEGWPSHIKHEELGVRPGLALGKRLGVPREWRLLGALTARYHLRVHRSDSLPPRSLVRFFRDAKFFERHELFEPFLLACEADAKGREGLQNRSYPQVKRLRTAFAVAREVELIGDPCTYHQERIRRVSRALRDTEQAA